MSRRSFSKFKKLNFYLTFFRNFKKTTLFFILLILIPLVSGIEVALIISWCRYQERGKDCCGEEFNLSS